MSSATRADRLRGRLAGLSVDAVIVSAPADVRYVTGFSGEGWVLLSPQTLLVTDGRFTLRAEREAPGVEVAIRKGKITEPIAERLQEAGVGRIGFQADHLTVSQRDDLQAALEHHELVPLKGLLREARMVKDADELALLRRAIEVTDAAFGEVVAGLKPGITEKELALEVERHLLRAGADKAAFEAIAASGPNSADPHAEPTDRRLARGDTVKLDFGGQVGGYHADLTRTVFLGRPNAEQKRVYRIVREAQQKAIEAAKAGVAGKDLDAVAREVIREAGHAEHFGHGLGHGVGLEIHEAPTCGQTSEDTLAAGMAITIEPGIYLKDWGGVRLEDVVLITEGDSEVLTEAAKLDFGG